MSKSEVSVCQRVTVSLLAIIIAILCLALIGLVVYVSLDIRAKPYANSTVYVLVSDGNLSNNSLLIELEELRSIPNQEVLESNFNKRIAIVEAHMQENFSRLFAKAENNTNVLTNLRDQLSSVHSMLSNTSNQLTRIQGNIDLLNSSQNVQQRNIDTFQTDLNALNTQVSDNAASLAENGQRLSDITDRITSFETDIQENVAYLDAAVENNTQRLGNLTEHVLLVADIHGDRLTIISALLSNFSNQLTLVNSSQNAQQGAINSLQTRYATLNSRVSNNRNDLTEQGERLDGRVDSLLDDTDMVTNRVTTLESRITALENSGESTSPLPMLTILCWSCVIHIVVSYITNMTL